MKLEAVLFDCDGVIADNEKTGHQIAFNNAFQNLGLNIVWYDELYQKLLKTGGGKERLLHYFNTYGWPENTEDQYSLVKKLHSEKSKVYESLIQNGKIKVRPGVVELMKELIREGIAFGICSTSREKSVRRLVNCLLPLEVVEHISVLIAGDVVSQKKPDPEIYLKAASLLRKDPCACVAVEDSEIGLASAKAAGMKVLITRSYYTSHDRFEGAILVANDLSSVDLQFIKQLLEK